MTEDKRQELTHETMLRELAEEQKAKYERIVAERDAQHEETGSE